MFRARGTFHVEHHPAPPAAEFPEVKIDRTRVEKRFFGALVGDGQVEMLSARPSPGDAAYVAIERITGAVDGRPGTFACAHLATMRGGESESHHIVLIPGSGTGELAGIRGSMTITMSADAHHYDLRYDLPDEPSRPL